MASFRFPVLQRIGHLEPPAELLGMTLQPFFHVGDFTNGAAPPSCLRELLQTHGFDVRDPESGLLFASTCGVSLHEDEAPSVLWALGGAINPYQTSHQLLVGNQSVTLSVGDVYLFDARKTHGVIASVDGLWAVFSAYIQRKRQAA